MRSLDKYLGNGVMAACVCVFSLASACSSAYRGAAEVDPSEVPRGRLVSTFARTSCTGNHADAATVFVDFVEGADGMPFIVERSRPDTWLLITNSRSRDDFIVFQAVRNTDAREFREYRFPAHGTKPGQYFWSSQYTEPRGSKHRFETQPVGQTTTCQLVPVDPLTGATLTTYGASPTPTGSASARGWGFDGKSFQVGDKVLVDVGGRSVPAEVLQAPGDAYYVRLEGEAEAGQWIDPSRITGRMD